MSSTLSVHSVYFQGHLGKPSSCIFPFWMQVSWMFCAVCVSFFAWSFFNFNFYCCCFWLASIHSLLSVISFIVHCRIHQTRETAEKAFADDFNTPKALEAVVGLMKYINLLMSHKTEVGAEKHTVIVWLWGSWKKQNKTKCDGRPHSEQVMRLQLWAGYETSERKKKERFFNSFSFTVLSLHGQFMMWVHDGRLQRIPNPSSIDYAACLLCVRRVMWLCDFKTPLKLCDFKTPVKLYDFKTPIKFTVLSFCNQFMMWLCVMVGFRKLQVLSLWCDCVSWWALESSKSWVYDVTVCHGGL